MAGVAPRSSVPTDSATPDDPIYTIADGALWPQQEPPNIWALPGAMKGELDI